MRPPVIFALGLLPGILAGLLLAPRLQDSPSPTPSQNSSADRKISKTRIIRSPLDANSETPEQSALKLSNWRDTHHLIHFAKLSAEISQLTIEDFPAALARAQDDDRIEVLLYQRWSQLAPRAALVYLLEETDYNSLDCLENDIPDVALLTGTALLKKEGKDAIPLIHKLMERVDEGGIGYNYGDFEGYEALFEAWTEIDFDSTLQFLMIEHEGFWYDGSNEGLVAGAAKAGKSKALLDWISAHPDTFRSYDLINRAMADWAQRDLSAALHWAKSAKLPSDENPLIGVAKTWLNQDSEAFLSWALADPATGLDLVNETARQSPIKVTEWVLENDDGSPGWQKIRRTLLSKLNHHGGAIPTDLERHFKVIAGLQDKQSEFLGKLFLKYTSNPGNYDPDGPRDFQLHETGPVEELAIKHGFQEEFARFKNHQEENTIESNRIKKEMQELSDTRNELHWQSGLEGDE